MKLYGRVIAPLKAKKVEHAVAALELFISSLAWEENSHFSVDENKKDIVESYRNYVGIHLNTYLKENDIQIDEEQLLAPAEKGSGSEDDQ